MSQIGEIMALYLQGGGGERDEGGSTTTTILELLRERMDGVDRLRRRKSLQERLGLKGMVCCGPTWAFGPSTISVRGDDESESVAQMEIYPMIHRAPEQQPRALDTAIGADARAQEPDQEPNIGADARDLQEPETNPECLTQSPVISGMNLAAALAAERNFRAVENVSDDPDDLSNLGSALATERNSRITVRETGHPDDSNRVTNGSLTSGVGVTSANAGSIPSTPSRVSLMRLLSESDGGDEVESGGAGMGYGSDQMCCVCMGRKKGAAFIPCGHTFCRVCSRELWVNRGACPLCNRSILEILDIY